MITRFANKLAKGRIRMTRQESLVMIKEKRRDDDDNLVWMPVALTDARHLDDLSVQAQSRETELQEELQAQRQAVANLEAIKLAVEAVK